MVSRFALYLSLVAGILSAVTAPILGAYSDRHGRRLMLVLSSLGLLASEITTILAAKYPHIFSVNFLLIGSIIDGVSGSFMVGMAVAHSYAADCTTVAERAVGFGYLQGALYLGIATGPALGGMLIKATGNVLDVFYAALVFEKSCCASVQPLTFNNLDCSYAFRCICRRSSPRVSHSRSNASGSRKARSSAIFAGRCCPK